jgi:hypothetical protein
MGARALLERLAVTFYIITFMSGAGECHMPSDAQAQRVLTHMQALSWPAGVPQQVLQLPSYSDRNALQASGAGFWFQCSCSTGSLWCPMSCEHCSQLCSLVCLSHAANDEARFGGLGMLNVQLPLMQIPVYDVVWPAQHSQPGCQVAKPLQKVSSHHRMPSLHAASRVARGH